MRTTIDLPDPLFREAKACAALEGTTLKDLVTRCVEQGLRGRRPVRVEPGAGDPGADDPVPPGIADDVLRAVRERAQRQRRAIGEVLSDLVRRSLANVEPADEIAEAGSFYGFEPFPPRGPVVTNALIDRLREEELE